MNKQIASCGNVVHSKVYSTVQGRTVEAFICEKANCAKCYAEILSKIPWATNNQPDKPVYKTLVTAKRSIKVIVAELDFIHVDKNLQVQAQGILTCISTDGKGWFSPELERFPSRQDLARISNIREVEL